MIYKMFPFNSPPFDTTSTVFYINYYHHNIIKIMKINIEQPFHMHNTLIIVQKLYISTINTYIGIFR